MNLLADEERALIVSSLHRIMKPFLLRRIKADVIAELPRKIERIVYCPQSALQLRLYELIRQSVEEKELKYGSRSGNGGYGGIDPVNEIVDSKRSGDDSSSSSISTSGISQHKDLNNSLFATSGVSFNNILMQLRKLCNHPYLVLEDIQSIPDELYYQYIVSASGKMCVLERLLKNLLSKGHKILIFSQMTTTLDIIQGYLQMQGIDAYRLDGSTSREEREESIEAFSSHINTNAGINADADADSLNSEAGNVRHDTQSVPIFLLSTRAGGVGINLQAADTVIFYDSDWNPQADIQAMSRAHRLGQTKTVLVLRLVTPGYTDSSNSNNSSGSSGSGAVIPSAEQRILRAASHKLAAERVVLADGQFDMGTSVYDSNGKIKKKKKKMMSLAKSDSTP